MPAVAKTYATLERFGQGGPGWLSGLESKRYASYDFYDDIIDNQPSSFALLLRGDEQNPIYVPSAKQITNTVGRYVCKDLGFAVTASSDEAELAAITAYGDLFKRERFFEIFAASKKRSLGRGDLVIYVVADPNKPQGSRITLKFLDPRTYFPIEDPNEVGKLLGARIIEPYVAEDKTYLRVQSYLKPNHPRHPEFAEPVNWDAGIAYENVILELENWETDQRKVFRTVSPLAVLESGITKLPLYHIKWGEDGDWIYGTSILQGMERIILGLNQTITDEDVAVAMAGLGMYRSSATPVDENNNPTDWIIGPKRVVETTDFERISGIQSLSPSQDHYALLKTEMMQTVGVNDVALGTVDTTVAESGIALRLRMGPILDFTDELDKTAVSVFVQFFHDLKEWLRIYEGFSYDEALVVEPVLGDKIPKDKAAEQTVIKDAVLDQVLSRRFYRDWLKKNMGLDIPDDEPDQILLEASDAAMAADPYAMRLGEESAVDENGNPIDPNADVPVE